MKTWRDIALSKFTPRSLGAKRVVELMDSLENPIKISYREIMKGANVGKTTAINYIAELEAYDLLDRESGLTGERNLYIKRIPK